MIYFNQNEKDSILQSFYKTSNDLRHIHKQTEEYRNYLLTVARNQIKDIKYVIANFDKINYDSKINNLVANIIYYLSGMNNLSEVNTENELKKYIKSKNKISLYTKILNDLEVM